MIEINLYNNRDRLPPSVDAMKRIAQVGGFFNSNLIARIDNKDARNGVVTGFQPSGKRIEMRWEPDYSSYVLNNPPMKILVMMDGLPTHIQNIIKFSDLNSSGQWQKFAETVGNIILDNTYHGNTEPDESMFNSGLEADVDIDAKAISIAASKYDPIDKTDGGTE